MLLRTCHQVSSDIEVALVLVGCSSNSPKVPGIYVISMEYHKARPPTSPLHLEVNRNFSASIASIVDFSKAIVQVRVSYFGVCLLQNGPTRCSTDVGDIASLLNESRDPLNLVWEAHRFKDDVLFPYFM